MSIISESIPELEILRKKREERLDGLILFKMTTKKWIKSRRKYIKKKIKYFSLMDEVGSYFKYDYKKKKSEIFLHEMSDKLTKSIIFSLESMTFEDGAFEVLRMFIKDRLSYQYIFLCNDGENIPVIKKCLDEDQEYLKKQDRENMIGNEEEDEDEEEI